MLTPAQHYSSSAFFTGIAAFTFLILVFVKSPNRKLARHFVWYAFSIAHWSFFVFACTSVDDHRLAYVLASICHFIGVFIPVAFLHFVIVLINARVRWLTGVLRLAYAAVGLIALSILIRPQLFIRDVIPKLTFMFFPDPGFLFYAWNILFVLLVSIAFFALVLEIRVQKGLEKKQLIFFLIGNALGYAGGIGCFLPVYHIGVFPFPYGIWGVFFFVCVTFYSVLRYRFIDIEVIIKRTIVFAGLFAMAMAVVAVVSTVTQDYMSRFLSVPANVSTLLSVLIALLLYQPAKDFLVAWTDRYLFQRKIDYRKLLREASQEMASIKSLKQLSRLIVGFLVSKGRISCAAAYSRVAGEADFVLRASRPFLRGAEYGRIPCDGHLVQFLIRQKKAVLLAEVENALVSSSQDNDGAKVPSLMNFLKACRAEAVIPSYLGRAANAHTKSDPELRSILLLGPKKSDEPYSQEDLDVFYTLAQESAIAIENARLYDQEVNRSAELARINEELNRAYKELKEVQSALMEEKKRALLAGIGKSIAHEVNNPLTPLAMNMHFVKQLLDELQASHEMCLAEPSAKNRKTFEDGLRSAKEKLLEAEKGKDRIKGVVQTLRDLVRQKTGEKKAVQLKIIVDSAIEEMKYQTYWETLSAPDIEVNIPLGLPFIFGIAHDLQGVLVNLFINSLHALEERPRDKKIMIEACEDQELPGMVRIEFSDNGTGMSEAGLKKCFEHGYTTKGSAGTGMGLFYCKRIIEEVHGGKIEAESREGVGTKFIIRVPRVNGQGSM